MLTFIIKYVIMESILGMWPWYVAGPLIALSMLLLIYFGKTFGYSDNLRTMCSMAGAGRVSSFFDIDWKKQVWNLMFVLGSVLGGFIAVNYLSTDAKVELSENTIDSLTTLGFSAPGAQYLPSEIFGGDAGISLFGILILLLGGILVGFGARYAGGCTSGHAITGLSNLQLPSLIAVIGFFIGGLVMTHLLFPIIF